MEKTFPAMFRNGIPGIGVPLLAGGCKDTVPDADLLREVLAFPETEPLPLPVFHDLRQPLDVLFQEESLNRHFGFADECAGRFPKDEIFHLLSKGRHYRPLLAASIFLVLSHRTELPDFLEPVLLAIECFHKASLIHDDIEDADELRYGEPTLHVKIGQAAAINAGDFLLGEGYRLLSRAEFTAEQRVAMLAEAARAHRELTLGQSMEFTSAAPSRDLEACLAIARLKTVPAFRVALLLGAVLAAGGIFYMHMKAQPHVDAKGLMERLEESSELTVEKSYYTGIVRFSEGTVPLINKNGFSMKYEAELDAGFELEDVSIEVTDNAVVVTVPKAEILSIDIDPDSLEFYDNKTSLFKTDRKEATKKALQEAEKDAEENASRKGVLEAADKRAEVIFKGILEGGVGNRDIIVLQKDSGQNANTKTETEEADSEKETGADAADSSEAETEETAG
jgi:hypothetical protein